MSHLKTAMITALLSATALTATPVIAKALVDLNGAPFAAFAAGRGGWAVEDAYVYPGPIQYWGPEELADRTTATLSLEAGAPA